MLYVPNMEANLISVFCIQEKGHSVIFRNGTCDIIRNSDNSLILSANRIGRNYKITIRSSAVAYSAYDTEAASRKIWHARMGHPSSKTIDELEKKQLIHITDKDKKELENCHACIPGKLPRKAFGETSNRNKYSKLELIHSDLCGPMQNDSLGGSKYFLIFVDNCTRMTYVSFLKKKSDCLCEFKKFYYRMKNQGHGNIQKLLTDNGTEYCNRAFQKLVSDHGIEHQLSAPYTPERND